MKIYKTAHKGIQKIPPNDAMNIIYALRQYQQKKQGYVKWLEGRPGYRIRIGQYRILFEIENDEMIILSMHSAPMET